MQSTEYDVLLTKILVRLNEMVREKGPTSKAFACADPLKDPAIPAKDVEYFFALGDAVGDRVIVPPAKSGERVVWTSHRLVRDPQRPLVMNYHIFNAPDVPEHQNYPLEKIHYLTEVTDLIARHIYDFIVMGDLPNVSDAMLN